MGMNEQWRRQVGPAAFGKLIYFLDFGRTDLITLAGSKVSSIRSAVNSTYTFSQGTDANRPTWNSSSALFGGRPSVTLAGSQVLQATANVTISSGIMTFFYVGKFTTASVNVALLGEDPAAQNQAFYWIINSGTLQLLYDKPIGSNTVRNSSIAVDTSAVHRYQASIDATAVNTGMHHYRDGTLVDAAYSGTAAGNGVLGSFQHRVFASVGAAAGVSGECSMLGMFDGLPYGSNYAALDDWLRWTNGL